MLLPWCAASKVHAHDGIKNVALPRTMAAVILEKPSQQIAQHLRFDARIAASAAHESGRDFHNQATIGGVLEFQFAKDKLNAFLLVFQAADDRKETFLMKEDMPCEGLIEKGQNLPGPSMLARPGKAVSDLFQRGAKSQQAYMIPIEKR